MAELKSGDPFARTISHTGTLVGFYSVAPVARPPAYAQTYAAAARNHPPLVAALVPTTAATNVAPFGYATAAQANEIPIAINDLQTDVLNVKNLLNSVIDDLQAVGLLQ